MKLPGVRTFVPPSGTLDLPYMGVGEQPGKQEVRACRVFYGPAGREADACLSEAGIGRNNCYMTNVVKDLDVHYSADIQLYKGTRLLPKPVVSERGQAYINLLGEEVRQSSATTVFGFGALALYALTGHTGIMKWRGSILPSIHDPKKQVVCTYHPSTVIPPKRQYTNRRIIIFDLKKVRDLQHGVFPRTERVISVKPSFADTMQFLAYCEEKGLAGERIGYDIEVYMDRPNKHISCISFSVDTQGMSIPFADHEGDYFTFHQEREVWLKIASILENPAIRKVGQNLTFDSHFLLKVLGIKVKNYDDTMVAQNLLMPDYPKGLDFITSIYTDHPYYKGDGKAFIKGAGGAYDTFWRYNALDSIICTEAIQKQAEQMEAMGNVETYERTIKVIEPLTYMMERGVRVDIEGLTRAREEAKCEKNRLWEKLDQLTGGAITKDSNKQLTDYFKSKGVKIYKNRTKDGPKPTFDSVALVRMIRNGVKEAKVIKEIRKVSKQLSNYLDIGKIDEDGRYRCSYNPVGTKFSRLSSSKNIFGTGGNMQNWPHSLQYYLLPDEGYAYYAIDLSQAENRIVAYLGRVIAMIEAFETGQDVHSLTAGMIFGKPPEEVTREDGTCPLGDGTHSERFWGKKANHGFNYDWGYKNFSLANELPEREGKFIYNRYHAIYPGVKQTFHAAVRANLRRNRMLTNLLGRKTIFYGKLDDNTFKEAYSCIPQGSVGDIINERGINYIYYDRDQFEPIELLRQVHDEIGFQIPLSVPWVEHARMLLSIKRKLETPLVTDYGREFVIPADITIGINMNKDAGIEFKKDNAPNSDPNQYAVQLEQAWRRLNEDKQAA
jgi:DNA polymerase I-like protein with 3'-5' exonuclease and polymerase domains/uracil-DNA glycosylase